MRGPALSPAIAWPTEGLRAGRPSVSAARVTRPGLADEVPGAVVLHRVARGAIVVGCACGEVLRQPPGALLEVALLLGDVDVHARSGPAGAGGSA
jgi:hypothetical protein